MEPSGHKTRGIVCVALAAAWLAGGSALAQQGSTPPAAQKPAAHPAAAPGHTGTTHPATPKASPATASHSSTAQKAVAHSSLAHAAPAGSGSAAHGPSGVHGAPASNVSHTPQHSAQHSASSARSRRYVPLNGQQRLARLHLEPERVTQIQQALIREGYLQGDTTGEWDAKTREAMLRYQTDHGFPATGLPEAKSLMKLGLGSHPLPADLDHGTAGSPAAAGESAAGAPAASASSQITSPPIPK